MGFDNSTAAMIIKWREADKQATYWQAHGHLDWSHDWAVVAKTLRQALAVGRGGGQVTFPTNPHPEHSDERKLKYRRPARYQGVSLQLGPPPPTEKEQYRERHVRRDSEEDEEIDAINHVENDETRFWKH